MLKEKYISEAQMKEEPKKKLVLKIKEGSITPEHLSQRVVDEVITPMIEDSVEEYKEIAETIATSGMTPEDKAKLNALPTAEELETQYLKKDEETKSDWNATTGAGQILNKPSIISSGGTTTISDSSAVEVKTGEELSLGLYNPNKSAEVTINPMGVQITTPNNKDFTYNGNKVATTNQIPAYLSQLSNDKGFITMTPVNEAISDALVDTVWNKEQTLSEAQKQQVRENIDVGAADNEDIQNVSGELKFADKAYNTSSHSGLGRKYLRKNIVTIEGVEKNVLTQAMVNTANTIYHIQYDYDLNGQTITMPAGCVLEFDGGSLKNGTLSGTFNIISKGVCLYEVGFDSAILDTVSLSWFDVQANVPCNDIFNSAFAIKCKTINIPSYDFPILVKEPNTSELGTVSCIRIKEGEKVIDFNNNTIKLQPTSSGVCKIVSVECSNATIKNLNILGDVSSHTGTTGETAHGLSLIVCSNVTLENINVAECWGDGICFIDMTIEDVGYYPQNISVINCHSLRNRRNALSIEAGRELKFLQCEFAYTGSIVGTSPFTGLDIEPWHDVEIAKVEGVTFSECSFHDNLGNGEVILSKASAFNNATINNITFNNCNIYHSTTNQSTHLMLVLNAGAVNIIGGVYGTPNKNGIINFVASSFIIDGAMVYGRMLASGENIEITKSNILACDANVSWKSALQLGSANAKIIDSNITSIVNTCLEIDNSTVEFNGCNLYDANEITSDDRQSLIYQSVVSMISCSLRLGSAIRLRAFAGSNHHFSIENSKWEKMAMGVNVMFINALKTHIASNTYDVEIKNTDLLCSSGQIFSRVDDSDDVKIYIEKFPNNSSIISYNEFRLLPTNDVDGNFPIINAGTIVMRDYVKSHLTQYQVGFKYFDKTLNKPLFWNGVNFVDATGTVYNTQKTTISGWTPEKVIYCNQGVGSAYDTSLKGLQGARYVIVPVVQGNVYVINGQGGSSPRLWCFADANNIILSVAETYAVTHFDYLVIVPPAGATQLIINNYSGYTEDCYELVP